MLNSIFDLNMWYSVSGVLITLLYIPQFIKVFRAQDSLEGISMITWGLWTLCLSVSSLYALQVAGDMKIALVSIGGTFFCGLITAVTALKRLKYRQASLVLRKG